MRGSCCLFIILGFVFVPTTFAGTPANVNFTESVYASGLTGITSLAWATDGSSTLFIAQKGGAIKVVRGGTLQATNFATVSPIFTSSECGAVGLCVDPGYATNKYVYVFATESSSAQKVFRYTAGTDVNGNLVGSGKTQIGPTLPCLGVNHDGGGIAFGPDGHIYFGVGNLGNGNNVGGNGTAGEFTSLGSKIGRMDRNGAAVSANPYYNATDGITAKDYIYARGMRNPFGVRFHPTTGALWVLMVGDSWEQIFLVPRDGNAGWPTENNTGTTNGLLIPKLAYRTNQSTFGGCVTRGVFYNGNAFPSPYQGSLFFVDYNSGKVMRSTLNGAGNTITNTEVFVNGNASLTDIAVGPGGDLYYSSHGGTVYRLRYTGSAQQNIVLSTGSLTVNEGANGTFGVRLAAAPPANVVVNVARTSGDTEVTHTPASLTFTPSNWNSPQTVTVTAGQDADSVDEGATITCSSSGLTSQKVVVTTRDNDVAAGAPRATITQPRNGDTVSGTNAEFYGDGADDVGCVKAEFYVDGALQYTDVNSSGHYHIGGDHLRWNTTLLGNGTHTLLMKVFDGNGLTGSHQITVTVSNTGPPTGLQAQYYDNVDFTSLRVTRNDATVNFDWGTGSPDPLVGADTFSVRWTGQVLPQYSETYTFYTYSDDGVRLWVNNQQIVTNWTDHAPTENSGTIALTAGRWYEVKMEYYENGGGATAKLSWSSPSRPKEIVPQSRLSAGASYKQDAGADGIVSMEVERYHFKLDQGGHAWSANSTAGFSGTGALASTPNNGAIVNTGYAAGSPRLDLKVNFVKTGTHHVWVRGIGATGSDDSCHVGLDGAETASSDRISTFFTTWTWSRDTMDGVSATINVASTGVHTLNLWMREDGFVADKIVLTTNVNYAPSGLGPTESPR